jgi:ubiquinone/menaquinone biosynthesis C-methylase UbiE
LAKLGGNSEALFFNFGYADLDPGNKKIVLKPQDECNRYFIQLYHNVAASTDWSGRDVLEVGCGRGGGASYLMRYLKPRSMHCIDISQDAVEFGARRHSIAGLSFAQGDALKLEFEQQTFDLIINVESSHSYSSVERFLAEARRVLRPGGYFLFADFRKKSEIRNLQTQLLDCGYKIIEYQDITQNVTRAIELDRENRRALMQLFIPLAFRDPMMKFLNGVRSGIYKAFCTGELVYVRYACRPEK